jgi:PST family polysaccharide transporter
MSFNRHDPRHALVRSALVLSTNKLTQRAVTGASSTFLGIALRTFLTLGQMSILARLLEKSDFGYIAMAAVITEFAAMLGSFGLTNILVQHRRIARIHLDTIFWTSLGIGCVLALSVFVLSSAAALLYGDDFVGTLLRVLFVNFIVGSLGTVYEAILTRLMRYHTTVFIQLLSMILSAVVAVTCALLGFGVWSLVAGSLSGAVVKTVFLIAIVDYRPRRRFSMPYLRTTWHTGSSYLGNAILYYICTNFDVFLIGRAFGKTDVGVYRNARSLTDEVRGRLAWPLQRVLFPALSSLQNDTPRLQSSFLKSSSILAAIFFPIGFGISATAEEIVPILYGEKWLAMIPIVTLLGINIAISASTAISPNLFYLKNRVGLIFCYNLVQTLLLVASIWLALPYGLNVTAGAITANALYFVVIFWAALRLIGLGLSSVLYVLWCPITASLLMWCSILFLREVSFVQSMNVALRLAIFVALGAVLYAAGLVALSRRYWVYFVDLVQAFRNKH